MKNIHLQTPPCLGVRADPRDDLRRGDSRQCESRQLPARAALAAAGAPQPPEMPPPQEGSVLSSLPVGAALPGRKVLLHGPLRFGLFLSSDLAKIRTSFLNTVFS